MLRFCLYICLPIPILLILFYSMPIGQEREYSMIGKTCLNRGNWMDNRLKKEAPIDYVILGSSHSIHGISEEIVARHLKTETSRVVNMGLCHYGRDLQYLILQRILEARQLKAVVVEIREEEYHGSHFDFPCFCSAGDLVEAMQFKQRRQVVSEAVGCRLKAIQHEFFDVPINYSYVNEPLGFRGMKGLINPEEANRTKEKYFETLKLGRDSVFIRPFYYLERIQALSAEKNVELYFFYLPCFNSSGTPDSQTFYEGLGTVLLPPDSILNNPELYYEYNHMNTQGAAAVSEWLGNALR